MIAAPIAFVLIVAALFVFVRWLEPRFAFFPAPGETTTPLEFGARFESTTIDTADGERLRVWHLHADSRRALIVYFHGNGGHLSVWAPILAFIARHGYEVIAFDYRGYGASTGRPSEQGLQRDVDAVIGQLVASPATSLPIVYWGRSLGAAMAAYASARKRPDGLILEAGVPDARSTLRFSPPLRFLAVFSAVRFSSLDYALA